MRERVLFRPPHETDPGDWWYRVTYGEHDGWWVNSERMNVLSFPADIGVDVVLESDAESFLNEHPEHREEDL